MPIIQGNFKRFDLPMEERCFYCQRKATRLCDAYTGIIFDAPNERGIKTPIQSSQCSIPMCDECTTRYGDLDFCKEHKKELYKILKGDDNIE